jgi:acyl-CoA hydrolase/GNAT superfamily N-acetyltransferase
MRDAAKNNWKKRLTRPEEVMSGIEPGMNIFIGTGAAEPRSLTNHLMASEAANLRDLTLVQLMSFGDTLSPRKLSAHKFRLKTFFAGWSAREAIATGRADWIPSRFSTVPQLVQKKLIPIDVAFVSLSAPNEAGYCSLGVAVDVARQAIAQAKIVVGEINPALPQTYGDTFVSTAEFDYLVQATDPPMHFPRWPLDPMFDRIAAKIASVINDGSCIGFTVGPIFEALGKHLTGKRNLGIHTPFFTDALMDLIRSGAVTNRDKRTYRGKTLTSYAFGTRKLYQWLDRNPLVEFQPIDTVFSPLEIGRNPNFTAVFPVRKVDLSGAIALYTGKLNATSGPGQAMDLFNGAEISPGGSTIVALPSRNLRGEANIKLSIKAYPDQINLPDSVDMVVTENGIARMVGRTVRERAQALIEIAHPEDRAKLIEQAKSSKILFEDQVFVAESAHLYPAEISERHTFKGNIEIFFRPIKPSDEEEMRRLFYRFSDQSVYYRYFAPIKTMPHAVMQDYVNVDFGKTLSIVGVRVEGGKEHIIAEGRYVSDANSRFADLAFVVDEEYQRMGIAGYLYRLLIRIARQNDIKGFTADVLASNRPMMKVFQSGTEEITSKVEDDVYRLTIRFAE